MLQLSICIEKDSRFNFEYFDLKWRDHVYVRTQSGEMKHLKEVVQYSTPIRSGIVGSEDVLVLLQSQYPNIISAAFQRYVSGSYASKKYLVSRYIQNKLKVVDGSKLNNHIEHQLNEGEVNQDEIEQIIRISLYLILSSSKQLLDKVLVSVDDKLMLYSPTEVILASGYQEKP